MREADCSQISSYVTREKQMMTMVGTARPIRNKRFLSYELGEGKLAQPVKRTTSSGGLGSIPAPAAPLPTPLLVGSYSVTGRHRSQNMP